jgi:hypothetical protein
MNRPHGGFPAVLTAIAVTLLSCSPEEEGREPRRNDPSAPSPAPSPSPSTFESERHGFRLDVPPGWEVTEYGGTWTSFDQFSPGAEVPGEDVALSPDGGSFLVANSMPIPEGMTPADWMAELQRLVESERDPSCKERVYRDLLAEEEAMVVERRCEGMNIVGRSLTHGDRGYYFTIGFPASDPTAAATLEDILGSIRFVDR